MVTLTFWFFLFFSLISSFVYLLFQKNSVLNSVCGGTDEGIKMKGQNRILMSARSVNHGRNVLPLVPPIKACPFIRHRDFVIIFIKEHSFTVYFLDTRPQQYFAA